MPVIYTFDTVIASHIPRESAGAHKMLEEDRQRVLHINDLTYRIEGRLLFDQATAAIADGWKVGFIGRNGTGKSTLLRLITDDISPENGMIRLRKNRRIGSVAQEAPAGHDSLLDTVIAADQERMSLLEAAETATDPVKIADIQTRLADIDAHSAEARAASVLAGLGFSASAQARACADFSGGWRMRVALAAALFAKPDLLLLDEPTNYLDLEGSIWLEGYLRRYPYTLIMISHDRDLLNKSVTHIMALEARKLSIAPGSYDQYAQRRAEQRAHALASRAKQDDARRHMEKFVERFRAKASKAKQAQSRLKMLEKMTETALPVEEETCPFDFPNPKMMAPPIVRLQNARLGYASRPGIPVTKPQEHQNVTVLRDVTLRIDQDDRIAILGANGQGKSTLVKAIAGRLKPFAGDIFKSKKLKIAYFAQHQLDELQPQQSAYDHIRPLMPEGTEAQIRARCAAIGFGPDKADTKVVNLSGGEKARLLFGIITFDGPHLMILDEPTNHLDIDSREALAQALNRYEGAVLLITHDSHLARSCVDRLWLVKDGSVERFDGDLTAYRQLVLDATRNRKPTISRPPAAQGAGETDGTGGQTAGLGGNDPAVKDPTIRGTSSCNTSAGDIDRQAARRSAARRRESLAPLKKRANDLETALEALTQKVADIDAILQTPGLFETHLDRATDLSRARARLVREIEEVEEAWLDAQEAYEEAKDAPCP